MRKFLTIFESAYNTSGNKNGSCMAQYTDLLQINRLYLRRCENTANVVKQKSIYKQCNINRKGRGKMKQKFTSCRVTLESVVHGRETKIEHTATHSGTLQFVTRPMRVCYCRRCAVSQLILGLVSNNLPSDVTTAKGRVITENASIFDTLTRGTG